MNLQMTTGQKVVAAFIGMVLLTVGLGIVAGMISRHNGTRKCEVNTSQAAELRSNGVTPIVDTVCVSPKK